MPKLTEDTLREFVRGKLEKECSLRAIADYFKCSMRAVENKAEWCDFCINVAVKVGNRIYDLPRREHTVEDLSEGDQQ